MVSRPATKATSLFSETRRLACPSNCLFNCFFCLESILCSSLSKSPYVNCTANTRVGIRLHRMLKVTPLPSPPAARSIRSLSMGAMA